MLKIATHLLISQVFLREYMIENNLSYKDDISACFVGIDESEKIERLISNRKPSHCNDFGMAIIIERDSKVVFNYRYHGYDLWASGYLACLEEYIDSDCTFGKSMYGIDEFFMTFQKQHSDIIVTLRNIHPPKYFIFEEHVFDEKEFLFAIIQASKEYFMFMKKRNIPKADRLLNHVETFHNRLKTLCGD